MKEFSRFVLFAFVGMSLIAGAQEVRKVPQLEFPSDSPAPNTGAKAGFIFFPQVDFGAFHSVQVNVDALGHNIPGDAANEPSITVHPNGRHHTAIGWRQFNSVTSNFRQGGYGYTSNGGASWTFPGVLENNVFRSDPVLGSSAEGKFFYLSLKETFYDDIWGSLTGGNAWSEIAEATGGDKQWMAIDNGPSMGHGNIYQHWSTAGNNWGGRQFSRSTDGGTTWMDPINIPNQPTWGVLDVARNGNLFLIGASGSSFRVLRSSNAQNSAVTPTFDQNVVVNLGGTIQYGQVINPGGLSGQAWLAIDKSVGLPTSNYIYALCSVRRGTTNPCDVMFSRSTDGGATWSTARRINDDPAGQTRYHWFGTLSVAPNGRIDAVWNDTRGDSTNTLSALFYSCSFDGGTTWTPNVQVGPTFNPHLGYPNQNKIGDYIGMVSDVGGANVAYAATYNGEEDVYYLRIPGPVRYNLNAVSIAMYEGGVFFGGVGDVWNSDGSFFTISTVMDQNGQLSGSAVADFTVPADAVNDLWLKTQIVAPDGTIEAGFLYNWNTQQFDSMGSFVLTQQQNSVTFNLQGDPTPYIGPGRTVRALVRGTITTGSRTGSRISLKYDLFRLQMN